MNYQKIILHGIEIYIDLDRRRIKCRKCDTMLHFGLTKNNIVPIEIKDGNYKLHFSSCKPNNNLENSILEEEKNQEELSNF